MQALPGIKYLCVGAILQVNWMGLAIILVGCIFLPGTFTLIIPMIMDFGDRVVIQLITPGFVLFWHPLIDADGGQRLCSGVNCLSALCVGLLGEMGSWNDRYQAQLHSQLGDLGQQLQLIY